MCIFVKIQHTHSLTPSPSHSISNIRYSSVIALLLSKCNVTQELNDRRSGYDHVILKHLDDSKALKYSYNKKHRFANHSLH